MAHARPDATKMPFDIYLITDVRFEKRELPSSSNPPSKKLTANGAIEKSIYKSPETSGHHPEATRSGR